MQNTQLIFHLETSAKINWLRSGKLSRLTKLIPFVYVGLKS